MSLLPFKIVNCRRCWRPVEHCACEVGALLAHRNDDAMARIQQMRAHAAAGGFTDDTRCVEQQRWAFLLWLADHGKLGR